MTANPRTLEDLVSAFDAPFYRSRVPVDLPVAEPEAPSQSFIRLIVPDSHGEHCDWGFADGMISDIEKLSPDIREVVWLGDHLDCGGTFNAHQKNYSHEMTESYSADVRGARRLINMVRERTPLAWHGYIEGNHEQHVERFLARNFGAFEDAEFMLDLVGPRAVLKLDELDVKYYRSSEMHMGLSIPGTIRLGKCYFTHGMSHARDAAAAHIRCVGASVVHGHTHRAQSAIQRTVTSDAIGAWCPGTLAKLQPLYRHTQPTHWTGGYGLQLCETNGTFTHLNVPLFGRGKSGLGPLLKIMGV
jgi:UDP-2,3-diacylglucosamine pyrophosphatase LpxH